KHFLGTHFFNPPRYLKLLEVIPTQHTNESVLNFMKQFGEDVLGKGVVEAKDTPNFIANRIGTYGLLVTVQEMLKANLSISQVDSVTGPLIGRPKSATFRTLDVVGLDTFISVADIVHQQVTGDEQKVFEVPEFMKQMAEKGWLGAKTKKGIFEQVRGEKGSVSLALKSLTFEFERRVRFLTPATDRVEAQTVPGYNIITFISQRGDEASAFIWSIIRPVLIYSAELVGEFAGYILAIDQAMK